MTGFDAADLESFRGLLRERLGFQLDPGEGDALAQVLRERMAETGAARFTGYWRRLREPATARDELRAVAERVTVGETFLFRNQDQLTAFAEAALPDRAAARADERTLRILSAGCASGEEPFTLAILLRDHLRDLPTWNVEIRGIDVNTALLEKARRARYSSWSLRQTSDAMRSRFFHSSGAELELDEAVRRMVVFEERNLLDEDPGFWRPGAFDVIFFRNVLIYFSPAATRAVVARLARALAPGGFLFLGDAETLRGFSNDFHLRHTHGAFYYQLREGRADASSSVAPAVPGSASREPVGAPTEELLASTTWIDAIHRASERIAALSHVPPGGPPNGAEVASTPAVSAARGAVHEHAARLERIVELHRDERFGEALELLRLLPPASSADKDVRLLRASILTNRGDVAEAEAECEAVLAQDELDAGAHYLKALCREHRGDLAGAAGHDRTAVYLDPAFAMPRLHLGLLARRAGDRAGARSELARAQELLGSEDASRILLFGGGFDRDALARLCEAELRAMGGSP